MHGSTRGQRKFRYFADPPLRKGELSGIWQAEAAEGYKPALLLTVFHPETVTLSHQNLSLVVLKLFPTAGNYTRHGGTSAHAVLGSEGVSERGTGMPELVTWKPAWGQKQGRYVSE